TSYAYVDGPLFCSQCPTSDPSARRSTDGTSAQLTNQSVPEATVRTSDHPAAVRSANFSEARLFSPRSIQLINTPLSETVNCGASLRAPAGDVTGSTRG